MVAASHSGLIDVHFIAGCLSTFYDNDVYIFYKTDTLKSFVMVGFLLEQEKILMGYSWNCLT